MDDVLTLDGSRNESNLDYDELGVDILRYNSPSRKLVDAVSSKDKRVHNMLIFPTIAAKIQWKGMRV